MIEVDGFLPLTSHIDGLCFVRLSLWIGQSQLVFVHPAPKGCPPAQLQDWDTPWEHESGNCGYFLFCFDCTYWLTIWFFTIWSGSPPSWLLITILFFQVECVASESRRVQSVGTEPCLFCSTSYFGTFGQLPLKHRKSFATAVFWWPRKKPFYQDIANTERRVNNHTPTPPARPFENRSPTQPAMLQIPILKGDGDVFPGLSAFSR